MENSLSKAERDSLIMSGVYIPKVLASKYKNKGIDFEDLIQEGYIGLIIASKNFDPAREVKFTTYAYFWVRQSILDAITSKSRTIRLPAHIVAIKLRVYKFIENFVFTLGYEPDVDLIAKELKVERHLIIQILGLNTEHIGDWEPFVECTIEDDLEQEDLITKIKKEIKHLNPKERLIIGMKFGILKSI